MSVQNRSWQELCEAASKESDSEQLLALVTELMKALDERNISTKSAEQESAVVLRTLRSPGVLDSVCAG